MVLQIEIDHVNERNRSVQKLPRKKKPDFSSYEPDLEELKSYREKYDYENLVIVGSGGSITSFRAYLYSFLPETNVDTRIVNTVDPDYLNRIKRELRSDDTLVLAISKSGETTTVIETVLYFLKNDYEVLGLTSKGGALQKLLESQDMEWVSHPDIGGRFTGAVETGLLPAAMAGMNIDEIRKGAEEMYEKVNPENQYNPALNLASALYDAEKNGYSQVFTGFYSTRMFGFYPLFVQLMHETVCKEGEGQSVFGDVGPEFQHHTNQRIFGGEENILPMFFRTNTHEHSVIEVPEEAENIDHRGRKLAELVDRDLQNSLEAEYRGVKEALNDEEMPNITLNLTELSYESAGKLLAFLQYTAVYSAWLRDVNPFDQPDVEKSKEKGFEARFRDTL